MIPVKNIDAHKARAMDLLLIYYKGTEIEDKIKDSIKLSKIFRLGKRSKK